jgi:hypothetical protein
MMLVNSFDRVGDLTISFLGIAAILSGFIYGRSFEQAKNGIIIALSAYFLFNLIIVAFYISECGDGVCKLDKINIGLFLSFVTIVSLIIFYLGFIVGKKSSERS